MPTVPGPRQTRWWRAVTGDGGGHTQEVHTGESKTQLLRARVSAPGCRDNCRKEGEGTKEPRTGPWGTEGAAFTQTPSGSRGDSTGGQGRHGGRLEQADEGQRSQWDPGRPEARSGTGTQEDSDPRLATQQPTGTTPAGPAPPWCLFPWFQLPAVYCRLKILSGKLQK